MDFAIDTFDDERFGLITGSTCSVLFPLRGDGLRGQRTYAKKLANNMFFKFYDERGGWQTEHGKMAEYFAREHYATYIDSRIEQGGWKRKGNYGGTIDAKIPGVKVVDFKCAVTLDGWLDYLHDPLDKEQIDQLQMYMYLEDLEEAEIAAYLIETQFMTDNGLVYPVPEQQRMIIVRVAKDPEWEERLNNAAPFVIKTRDEFYKNLKERFKLVIA
jgi:hypothetical protein